MAQSAGILYRIPHWWKSSASGASLNFSVEDSRPSMVGMEAILSFKPEILLGGEPIEVKVSNGEWLKSVFDKLHKPGPITPESAATKKILKSIIISENRDRRKINAKEN